MSSDLNILTPAASAGASTATHIDVDFTAIKQRQQATWASGDYGNIGIRLQIVGESLAEAVDLRADERVVDVAAGNGNATLAAARRFARGSQRTMCPIYSKAASCGQRPKDSTFNSRWQTPKHCRSKTDRSTSRCPRSV